MKLRKVECIKDFVDNAGEEMKKGNVYDAHVYDEAITLFDYNKDGTIKTSGCCLNDYIDKYFKFID